MITSLLVTVLERLLCGCRSLSDLGILSKAKWYFRQKFIDKIRDIFFFLPYPFMAIVFLNILYFWLNYIVYVYSRPVLYYANSLISVKLPHFEMDLSVNNYIGEALCMTILKTCSVSRTCLSKKKIFWNTLKWTALLSVFHFFKHIERKHLNLGLRMMLFIDFKLL